METSRRLVFNAARCNKCNTMVVSKFRHDYQSCYCGDIAVDGGFHYQRLLYADGADYTDLSVYEGDE